MAVASPDAGRALMLARRNWLLRTSIVLNVVVLLYVGTHIASWNGTDMVASYQGSSDSNNPTETGKPPQQITLQLEITSAPTKRSTKLEKSSEQLSLAEVIGCRDRDAVQRTEMRGDYWVIYNYVRATRTFRCWESITYTTHADFTFLDNLETLLHRWQGPISVALHAPGDDLGPTLDALRYLVDCSSAPIADLVTFHIYFPSHHVPRQVPSPENVFTDHFNCSWPPPWASVGANSTYRKQNELTYPVNVGRNVARKSALTHYILPSDIELYPSPGVIPDFLEMVRRQDAPLLHKKPKVFPLSVFELKPNMSLPVNKSELVGMLRNGLAVPFHETLCPLCHKLPASEEWQAAPAGAGLRVFYVGKRSGVFFHWEPFYIGTHAEPLYDERLTWEGMTNKLVQGYILCLMDYEFHILDNAFLVHKPGIKTLENKLLGRDQRHLESTIALINNTILPELEVLYGFREGCAV